MLKGDEFRRAAAIAAALLLAALVATLVLWETRPAEAAFRGTNGKITFARDPEVVNQEIYVMDANGSNQTRLTSNDQVFDSDPTFAPNGTRIAFDSFRNINWDA